MTQDDLDLDLEELVSAEDFLDYFRVEYDPAIVHVNRLHILQRFHDYLTQADLPDSAEDRFTLYRDLLTGAYADFVGSDARTEKVFRVFRMGDPHTVMVPVSVLQTARTDA